MFALGEGQLWRQGALISLEKSVQAGSSCTPPRPAPTAHVPASKTALQAGPNPCGWCGSALSVPQTPAQEPGGAAATSPRLLKVKMEAKALGSKTGILNQRSQDWLGGGGKSPGSSENAQFSVAGRTASSLT